MQINSDLTRNRAEEYGFDLICGMSLLYLRIIRN